MERVCVFRVVVWHFILSAHSADKVTQTTDSNPIGRDILVAEEFERFMTARFTAFTSFESSSGAAVSCHQWDSRH